MRRSFSNVFLRKKLFFKFSKKKNFRSHFVRTLCDEEKQRRITVTCTTRNFFATQTLHDTWLIARAQCCLRNNWCSMKNLSKHSFPKTWYKFSFCNSFFHCWPSLKYRFIFVTIYFPKKKKMTLTFSRKKFSFNEIFINENFCSSIRSWKVSWFIWRTVVYIFFHDLAWKIAFSGKEYNLLYRWKKILGVRHDLRCIINRSFKYSQIFYDNIGNISYLTLSMLY